MRRLENHCFSSWEEEHWTCASFTFAASFEINKNIYFCLVEIRQAKKAIRSPVQTVETRLDGNAPIYPQTVLSDH